VEPVSPSRIVTEGHDRDAKAAKLTDLKILGTLAGLRYWPLSIPAGPFW